MHVCTGMHARTHMLHDASQHTRDAVAGSAACMLRRRWHAHTPCEHCTKALMCTPNMHCCMLLTMQSLTKTRAHTHMHTHECALLHAFIFAGERAASRSGGSARAPRSSAGGVSSRRPGASKRNRAASEDGDGDEGEGSGRAAGGGARGSAAGGTKRSRSGGAARVRPLMSPPLGHHSL